MDNTYPQLDLQNLNSEYINWTKENGVGRNANDQRFGQYIHNNYDLSFLGYVENDGFYEEGASNSLNILTDLITFRTL